METWNRKLATRPIGSKNSVIYNLLGRAGLYEAVVKLTTQYFWTHGGVVNYASGSRKLHEGVARFTSAIRRDDKKSSTSDVGALLDIDGVGQILLKRSEILILPVLLRLADVSLAADG